METANLRDARLVLGSRVTKNAPLIGRSRLLLIHLKSVRCAKHPKPDGGPGGKKSFGETLPRNQKKFPGNSWKFPGKPIMQ